MITTYRQYRGYGHGWFVSATLSINPMLWFAVATVIGFAVGYGFLWSAGR